MDNTKNVLLIIVDQWQANAFSHRGHPIVKTKNVDRLAAGGLWYENAFTCTPLCSPARAALLSAQWPHQAGMIDNPGGGASKQRPLGADIYTVLDAFIKHGYKTGYFGKWHLGGGAILEKDMVFSVEPNAKAAYENNQGPASEKGELTAGSRTRFMMGKASEPGDKPPYYAKMKGGAENKQEYKVTGAAARFLEENAGSPWFTCVSYVGPHFPHTIPEPYCSMYDPEDIELPASIGDRFIMKPWFQNRNWWPCMETQGLSESDWKKCAAYYYGYITYVDDEIGRLLDAVEKNDGGRETTVVFTADHGEMLGAHSRFDKGAYFYEEVMRIPLMLSSTRRDRTAACEIRSEYCGMTDIGATLFELAGDECRASGKSLLSGGSRPDRAYGAYYKYNGHSFEVRAIRTPEWKYSYVPQDIDELYDLVNDPHELANLVDREEYAEVKAGLKAELWQWMRSAGDYLAEPGHNLPPAGSLN